MRTERGQNMELKELQITPTPKEEKVLHAKYGHTSIKMVRGAGKLCCPKIMLIFMNPTARNVSAGSEWKGIRAPWIGTKQVWQMLARLGLVDKSFISKICNLHPEEWNEENALQLYKHIADCNIYITNMASCTQPDARSLPNTLFKEYLSIIFKEIEIINPTKIITFGNQVSSILLQKNISVSNYSQKEFETLNVKNKLFNIYPTYYPVGQGQRNLLKAIKRIRFLIK